MQGGEIERRKDIERVPTVSPPAGNVHILLETCSELQACGVALVYDRVLNQSFAARPDIHSREVNAEVMAGLPNSPTAKMTDFLTPAQLKPSLAYMKRR